MKKIISLLAAMALIAASAGAAFAATGTGSVSVTGAKEGETYSFYRVLDLDYLANGGQEAFAYTVNPDFQDFFDAALEKTGGESARAHEVYEYINAQNTADELEALCVALGSYALDRSIAPAMALETDASGSASKDDAGFGYYLMVPEAESGSAIFALDTVKPDAEIANKSVYPTVTKTVSDADETDAETNVAGVGDVLTFKLSSAVPVMTGYTSYTFRFVDTMTNMSYVPDSAEVTVGGVSALKAGDAGYAEHVSYDAGTKTLTVDVPDFISYKDSAGAPVVMTYEAVLDSSAVIGGAGNPNVAKIVFSNDPRTEETDESEEVRTVTFALVFVLDKVLKNGDAYEPLTGSSWMLEFRNKTSGEWETVYSPGEDGGSAVIREGASVSLEDPVFSFSGLDAGDYRLTETDAPEGYRLLDDPILFTVNSEGQITDGAGSLKSLAIDITSDPMSSVAETGAELTAGRVSAKVVNTTFEKLPGTGGDGLGLVFSVAILLLVAALIPRRGRDE